MGLGFSRAKFPDDDHALGPFLGNLPPEILDDVVQKLGWFRTTFAMAGKTCREVVERVPSTRAELTDWERGRLRSPEMTPLAVAVVEGDVEAVEWLIQLFDGKDLDWRDVGSFPSNGVELSRMAAVRGKIESLKCLRANQCPWDAMTCSAAARGGHLEVLRWSRQNGCPWDAETCFRAAQQGHLEVLQWAHQNGCPWYEMTWNCALLRCRPYLLEHGCPGADESRA